MRCTPFERRMINGVLIAVAISVTFSVQSTRLSAAGPTTCENLATLALPDATITIAQLVPAEAEPPVYCLMRGALSNEISTWT